MGARRGGPEVSHAAPNSSQQNIVSLTGWSMIVLRKAKVAGKAPSVTLLQAPYG